jgi:CHAD domain-containing protein
VRASKADIVIAVGHNPFIESLTKHLTGASIPFATGGFVAIRIDWADDDDFAPSLDEVYAQAYGRSRLLWFAQGPISQRWKTLVQLEKALSSSAQNVKDRLEAFFDNPEDIETMHKFRVSIRTLRSLLVFTSAWQDADQNAEAQDNLRALVAETSRLRELDVLSEQAREANTTEDTNAFCIERAASERSRVMKALAGKRSKKQLESVIDGLSNIRWKRRVSSQGLSADEVRGRFDEMVEELQDDLEMLDLADVERTHSVRKDAKRARYVAEKFSDIVGEDAIDIAKSMTNQQDRLGAICDARVNIDIINDFEQQELPETVAWDLALLRAQNETFLYTTLRDSGSKL